MAEVTIVGAGVVGCFLGQQLKKEGIDTEIFEEHQEIGVPKHCTGLFSKNIDNHIEVPKKLVLNTLKGAIMVSPGGRKLNLTRKSHEAYLMDRVKFDKHVADGLDVQFGKRIDDLNFDSKYIVGADGTNSTVAKLAGFPELEESIVGMQYEIPNESHSKDYVELHFGNDIAPGFFAWITPTDKTLKVGLATYEKPKKYLDKFVEKHFGSPEILDTYGGIIPMKWRDKLVKENIAVVGDAAGQAKPTTGGGVYMGFRSAEILAEAIKLGGLSHYQKGWDKTVRPELKMGRGLRNILKRMSDKQMDQFWKDIEETEVKDIILEHGDMDNHAKMLKTILKNPKLLKYIPYLKEIM